MKEIKGENTWTANTTSVLEHTDFAKMSFKASKDLVIRAKQRMNGYNGTMRVLDLGAGCCFQSWQFAQHGFQAFAVDLCPEFIFASNEVVRDTQIERFVADCTVLPFKDKTFDVVFCKELVHHIESPKLLFNEIARVAKSEAVLIVKEPSCPVMFGSWLITKYERATKAGITHFPHTYWEYMRHFKKIACNIDTSSKIMPIDRNHFLVLSLLQQPLLMISRIPIVEKIYAFFIGGDITLVGSIKRTQENIRQIEDVRPIDVESINRVQLEFYRHTLIPTLLLMLSEKEV